MALPNSSVPVVKKDGPVATVLSAEQVEAVIKDLPVQGRVVLRLLLLQYLDLTQEDIAYMAADRPDPRFQAGNQPKTPIISREAIQGIADRVEQYRSRVRRKRERTWLQMECLRKQIALSESFCSLAEQFLVSRFTLASDRVQELKKQARTALSKPALRALEQKWEKGEIEEEDYRRERLSIEYQTRLRKLERERKRLETVEREHAIGAGVPLQDHEIAHIWGIPASSLAGRKLKYLNQYLQSLQASVQASKSAADQAALPPVDLWKDTFAALAARPIEHSVAAYDGLERTEEALLEKLRAFADGTFPEEIETRFWLTIVQESSQLTEYGTRLQSLFALQRLAAILAEVDTTPDALEQELLSRISPKPKVAAGESLEEKKTEAPQLSEMGEHVLKSFTGEEHHHLRS
jgi:hypothetical protein